MKRLPQASASASVADPAGGDPCERERHHDDRDPADDERRGELPEVVVDPRLREREVQLGTAIRGGSAHDQRGDAVGLDPVVADLSARRDVAECGRDR